MASVVLLKGVNVGGHRTFRPSELAKKLKRLDVVNIGAAGTFVVHQSVPQATLRAEVQRRLPFEADIMICPGRELLRLVSDDPFVGQPSGPTVVRFVSVMAKRRAPPSPLPVKLPESGAWGVKVLHCQDRFVCGLYRRNMKAIGYLGRLENVWGVSLTTRNWNTVLSIARELESD